MSSLSIPLAFIAGLLSILSPCVFSLIPMYLGYLSGTSAVRTSSSTPEAKTRWRIFSHALVFVAGFTLIFVVVMGLPTTLLSSKLQQYSVWISRMGGLVLILFALHTMHIIEIPWFNITRRAELGKGMTPGYARSLLFGITFAASWSPCVGPLLGMVMTLSFSEPGRAMVFMLAYALGIATPFLLAALLLSHVMTWVQGLVKYGQLIEWISGGLMLSVGLLMVLNLFSRLNGWLMQWTPSWLIQHL